MENSIVRFIPIEADVHRVRHAISRALPKRVLFTVCDDPQVLSIDWTWISRIVVPDNVDYIKLSAALNRRCETFSSALDSLIGPQLQALINQPSDKRTLRRANEILNNLNARYAGVSSSFAVSLLHHCLGITPMREFDKPPVSNPYSVLPQPIPPFNHVNSKASDET